MTPTRGWPLFMERFADKAPEFMYLMNAIERGELRQSED